jgi:FkbM family methyltransferase
MAAMWRKKRPDEVVTDNSEVDATGAPPPGAITREHVIWAYRLLLDRDPENEDVIGPKLAGSGNTRELRHHLMTSAEFQEKNRDYAHTNDRTIVIKELDGANNAVRLFVDLSDHIIGLNIIRGSYEADGIALMRAVLKPGDSVIDVGAHIGFFTMQMAAAVGPAGVVYAFEPFAANATLLERSIGENRFDDRVVFRRAAAGASSGTATLTFPPETLNSGGAYMLRPGAAPLPGHLTTTVPMVALDDLALARPVRFIKMDVEGAEPQVVVGATRLLKDDRPRILAELHPTQLERVSGMTPEGFLNQLRALGYRAHGVDGGGVGAPFDRAPADAIVSVVFIPT